MLDGLHFPHILDTVLDHSEPITLVGISQVCHRWRLCVKPMFYHMTAHEDKQQKTYLLLSTKEGRTFERHTLTVKAPILLHHCHVLDTEPPSFCRCLNGSRVLDDLFPSLEAGRISDYWSLGSVRCGMRTSYHRSPRNACPCCHWHGGPRQKVRRFVLTTWGEDAMFDTRLPGHFDSLSIMLLFESAPEECQDNIEEFWDTFARAVVQAWRIQRPTFIINAESLNNRPLWVQHLPGQSVEEKLRLLALEAVYYEVMSGLSEFDEGSPVPSGLSDFDNAEDNSPQPVPDDITEADTSAISESLEIATEGLDSTEGLDLDSGTSGLPPGPVCPVHFLTLDEYRALFGEHQFAIETQRGWISEP